MTHFSPRCVVWGPCGDILDKFRITSNFSHTTPSHNRTSPGLVPLFDMPSGDTPGSGPIRLLIVAGGPSAEHDVSILSARNVLQAVSQSKKLQASLLVITKQGRWLSESQSLKALAAGEANHGGRVTPAAPISEICAVVFSLLDGWEGGAGAILGILERESVPYLGGGSTSTVLTR